MYDAAVGDCFLLAFAADADEPFYMLIDCGVHSQVKGGSQRVRDIVTHVRQSTSDHLNVLVVTHEHGDHISGFHAAHDQFSEQMTIDEAWFAWTEDDENPMAKRLDRARSLMLRGLEAAGPQLAADGGPAAANVDNVVGFFGIGDGLGVTSRETRDKAKALVDQPRYLYPKTAPIELPGVENVRIFVLGPPEDERFLMRARPSSKPGEVYEEHGDHALSVDEALSMALLGASGSALDDNERWWSETAQPFSGNYRRPAHMVEAGKDHFPFFHSHYGFVENDPDNWRRISSDWRMAAESLALKLDSATNNTSLVLAIELRQTRRVLLFAADAQVGNWQSWHDGGWSDQNGLDRDEDPITARDLLARTVLYKVGHHGSHNATLREQGLELMTSPDLTAMIPVDSEWAHARKPHPWKMPFGPLYRELMNRTKGRILRADVGLVEPDSASPAWEEYKSRVRAVADEPFVEVDVLDV